MPTTKKRIQISLSPHMEKAIKTLAGRDAVPEATMAADLLRRALEAEEDEIWDALASQRDTKRARFISHKNAWK